MNLNPHLAALRRLSPVGYPYIPQTVLGHPWPKSGVNSPIAKSQLQMIRIYAKTNSMSKTDPDGNPPNPEDVSESEAVAIQEFYRRQEVVMDDEDAARQELRRASLTTMEFFFRGLRLLAQYQGNRNMALDCFILAHGQGDMIGMHSAVEVAVKHFQNPKKRAAVTKCIKLFQDCLNIEAMPGQRGERGRKNMADSRKGQLK